MPLVGALEHVHAAETATRELNAPFPTVILEGRYTEAEAGADAQRFTPEELEIIPSPVDFVGINVYRPNMYVVPSPETARQNTVA